MKVTATRNCGTEVCPSFIKVVVVYLMLKEIIKKEQKLLSLQCGEFKQLLSWLLLGNIWVSSAKNTNPPDPKALVVPPFYPILTPSPVTS